MRQSESAATAAAAIALMWNTDYICSGLDNWLVFWHWQGCRSLARSSGHFLSNIILSVVSDRPTDRPTMVIIVDFPGEQIHNI